MAKQLVEVLPAASAMENNVVSKVPVLAVEFFVCICFDICGCDLVEGVNLFAVITDCIFVVAATVLSTELSIVVALLGIVVVPDFVSLLIDVLNEEGAALLAVDTNLMKLSEDVSATGMVVIVVTGVEIVEVGEGVVTGATYVAA